MRKRAFTLMELLIVVTLIGVIAVVVMPNFSGARLAEQLLDSGRRMESIVAMCRAEAMNEGARYRLEIRRDGTVRVRRQLDPILAPHAYTPVKESWANTEILLDTVWVEAVQRMPDGPPPVYVIDERLEFPEMELALTPVTELETDVALDFNPDGSCPSLRLVLRDVRGSALLLTLDGRLGRILSEDYAGADEDAKPTRPDALPVEEEPDYKIEDLRK